jgi:hypothetical protein
VDAQEKLQLMKQKFFGAMVLEPVDALPPFAVLVLVGRPALPAAAENCQQVKAKSSQKQAFRPLSAPLAYRFLSHSGMCLADLSSQSRACRHW